jgi:hypothetical protein
MNKLAHRPIPLAVFALSLGTWLCACGGSEPGSNVATVGKSEITQAQLSHWMATDLAGDYRQLNGRTLRRGSSQTRLTIRAVWQPPSAS